MARKIHERTGNLIRCNVLHVFTLENSRQLKKQTTNWEKYLQQNGKHIRYYLGRVPVD